MITHQNSASYYLKFTFLLFFLAASYGWLLRLNGLITLPFVTYIKILQAHSHVAFLGWGFLTIAVFFNCCFLSKQIAFSKKYRFLFAIQLISIALMLVSFAWQGYKVFSIVLLSVYAITSYAYIYLFYKDNVLYSKAKTTQLFIKAAVFYYLIAMFAIWAIGTIAATQGKGELYHNTIYFYLHFLYNGFFIFALFGLFFHVFENKLPENSTKNQMRFFWFLFIACAPSYLLSLVKSTSFFVVSGGFLAGFLQLIALYYFIKILTHDLVININKEPLLRLIFVAFVLKLILQFVSAFPSISQLLPALKSYFVIGYIHLVTLGIISAFLVFLLQKYNFILLKKQVKLFFVFGVISTEFLLFIQGVLIVFFKYSLPYYTLFLFLASTVLLISLFQILIQIFKPNNILN